MIKDFDEYQQLALSTASIDSLRSQNEQLVTACLGLSGETGEFCDSIKKYLYQGHDLDSDKLEKELGDILWYLSLAADALSCYLSRVATDNIIKLRKRYPEKFTSERSINREE